MKLQILIPHRAETLDEVKPLLDSVAIQQSVDFSQIGVVLADDGEDAVDLGRLDGYPFEIKRTTIPKSGVSAARNAALDVATADYVMFCDADDMFMNACGLYIVFEEIENGGFDMLVSKFIEESRRAGRGSNTKKPLYVDHDMDFTFVHGKVFSRGFLLDAGIRWDDSLTVHEDSYFNFLAMKCAGRLKHCPTAFYLWKWRDGSVCRHDPKYMLKTFNNMLESNTRLVDEFKRRGMAEAACEMACQTTFESYYTMNKKEWLDQENQEYRTATERRFAEYYRRFGALLELVGEAKRAEIIMGIRNRMFVEGVTLEDITFKDWIKHIMSDYPARTDGAAK